MSYYTIIHPGSPLSVRPLRTSLNVAQLVRSLDALPPKPGAVHMEIRSLFGGPAENLYGYVLGLFKYGVMAILRACSNSLDSQVAAMTPNQGWDALKSITCQALFVPCGGVVFHQRHMQKRALCFVR